jgi:hypothetical protein
LQYSYIYVFVSVGLSVPLSLPSVGLSVPLSLPSVGLSVPLSLPSHFFCLLAVNLTSLILTQYKKGNVFEIVTNELERCGRKRPWLNLMYYPQICLQENQANLS